MADSEFTPVVGTGAGLEQPAQTISSLHVTFMIGVHGGALASTMFFSWTNLAVMFVLYVATGLGITVGYHRLLGPSKLPRSDAWSSAR